MRAEDCALPAETELTRLTPPPADHWTHQEKWVWARTLAGEIADFNALYCATPPLDPSREVEWSSNTPPRRLSAQFLLDLITMPEFANAVPRRGIRIFGAWFVEGIDLAAVEFNKELWFNDSRFDGEFHMRYTKVANLSVEGSTFEQKVDLENAQFETHLLMSANATFNWLCAFIWRASGW